MNVVKRDGSLQQIDIKKIYKRLKFLADGYPTKDLYNILPRIDVNVDKIIEYIEISLCDNIKTSIIDNNCADYCSNLSYIDPKYGELAARIAISNHHKETRKNMFCDNYKDIKSIMRKEFIEFIDENKWNIQQIISYESDYKLTYFGFKTLKNSYLLQTERPQDLFMRVAICLHLDKDISLEKKLKLIEETYEQFRDLKYTHASPTLFNIGTNNQQLLSCFIVGSEDSSEGIMNTLSNLSEISRRAGGIGMHFPWRSSGSNIGKLGKSNGPIPFLQMYDKMLVAFNQGGKRKGSGAMYMNVEHPDISSFIRLRLPYIPEQEQAPDLFLGISIPDLFMVKCIRDDVWFMFDPKECPELYNTYGEEYEKYYNKYVEEKKYKKSIRARTLCEEIAKCQLECGLPYIFYRDMVNRKSNHQNIGMIKSSNLCVAPETMVLTDKGYVPIYTRRNLCTNIWNGKEFSEVIVRRTARNANLMKITFSDGTILYCSKNHKFYIDGDIVSVIDAKDLHYGMKLIPLEFPIIDNNMRISTVDNINNGKNGSNPPFQGSIQQKLIWFENYYNSNGIVSNDHILIRDNYDTLFNARLLLQSCGINIHMYNNNGWRLYLNSDNIRNIIRLKFGDTLIGDNTQQPTIILVEAVNRLDDTYCFTEPKEHKGVFNGLLTGQCSEIEQYSSNDEYACCTLASIALPRFVKDGEKGKYFDFADFGKTVSIATKNLDTIVDINAYPVAEAEISNLKHRPLGLGVQGLADVFTIMEISWDSKSAKKLNDMIFEHLYYYSVNTSCEISRNIYKNLRKRNNVSVPCDYRIKFYVENNKVKKMVEPILQTHENVPYDVGAYTSYEGSPISRGVFQHDMWDNESRLLNKKYPDLFPLDITETTLDWDTLRNKIKKFGVRNSLNVALMPTASTSQILGNNECFEPYTGNIYRRQTLAGQYFVYNKYLIETLINMGIYEEDTRKKILNNFGRVSQIDIPDRIKSIYKTAYEISPSILMQLSESRGKFVDQSQSMNLFINKEQKTIKNITAIMVESWRRRLKTGLYYLRSESSNLGMNYSSISAENTIVKEDDICVACSG